MNAHRDYDEIYRPVQPYQPRPPQHQQVRPHSPVTGAMASAVIPGLGSLMSQRGWKGVLILVLWLATIALGFGTGLGFLLTPVVWVWGMVAGYRDAQKWNRAHGVIS